MNCLNCGVELKTTKYQPSAVQKLVTGKCLDCVYEERRQKTEWWVPCGTCRHRIGFGIKNLGRRYGFGPANIRNRLIVRGVYQPGKVNPSRRGKRRGLSRAEKLIMEHYRRELVASDRHGKMMTAGMISYYWKHEDAKEKAIENARNQYKRIKADADRHEKYKNSQRRRMRKLMSERPDLRLRKNLSTRLCMALKGRKNWNSVVEYIGCSTEHLANYLEKRFKKGMTWQNYGKSWQVDHIVPCAVFDHSIESEVKRCWHFSNLRPLWSGENNAKSSKIVPCQPELTIAA